MAGDRRGRCDSVIADQYGAQRCILHAAHQYNYYITCQFSPTGDQEVCERRSTNHSSRLTRYCAMTRDHDGLCVYLWMTERTATSEEMALESVTTS